LPTDIRAEVLAAQLVQCGIAPDKLVFFADRFFYRSFSRDLFDIEMAETAGLEESLHLHLSRAGLYDLLPEGIFFQAPETEKAPKNAAEMAAEYAANKKQELTIRKFFAPLENEFFRQRHKNFSAETDLLRGLGNESLNRYFKRFWELPADMETGMALRTLLLLPYVHQVSGDAPLMARCLQTILNEETDCRIETRCSQQSQLAYNQLGVFELGNRLTCGDEYEEEDFVFVFTIKNLQQSHAQDYLEGGRLYSTLQTFYRFFVPAAAEAETAIEVLATRASMHTGTEEGAILGIATIL
jgi:hypothetical protein